MQIIYQKHHAGAKVHETEEHTNTGDDLRGH